MIHTHRHTTSIKYAPAVVRRGFYWRAAIIKINSLALDDVQYSHNRRRREYNIIITIIRRPSVRARSRSGGGLRAVSVWKCEGSLRPEDLSAVGTYRGRRVKPLINYDRTIVAAAVAVVALLPLFHRHCRILRSDLKYYACVCERCTYYICKYIIYPVQCTMWNNIMYNAALKENRGYYIITHIIYVGKWQFKKPDSPWCSVSL